MKIAELCKKYNINNQQLAHIMGYKNRAVAWNKIHGRNSFSLKDAYKIANFFKDEYQVNVSFDDFF